MGKWLNSIAVVEDLMELD